MSWFLNRSKMDTYSFQYDDKTKAGISLDSKGVALLQKLEERLFIDLYSIFENWKIKYSLTVDWEQFRLSFSSYYDPLMIARFLVGKQMDSKKAEEMILKDWHWRLVEVNIDQFMIDYPQTAWFKFLSSYYPTTCHGFDKYGVEVNWERLACIDLDSLFEYVPFKELIAFHIFAVESSERRVRKQMNQSKEFRFRRVLFEDLEGLSLKHLSSKTIDLLKITAEIDDTHYPESLRKLYFIQAPSVFSFFYKAITPFLDKRTVAKLKIVSASKHDKVLASQIPNKFFRPSYLIKWTEDNGDPIPCILCHKTYCFPQGGKVTKDMIPIQSDTKEMSTRKNTMKLFSKKKQSKVIIVESHLK
jgi:CRAL/TRIO domain